MAKKTKKKKKTPKPGKKKAARKPARKKKAAARKVSKARRPAKKKSSASKASRKSVAPAAGTYQPAPNERLLGEVDDYFSHVEVIALYLKDSLSVGDTIHVHGHTTDYTVTVGSMQIDHQSVQGAKKGDSVGIKVPQKSRKGDRVYRVV